MKSKLTFGLYPSLPNCFGANSHENFCHESRSETTLVFHCGESFVVFPSPITVTSFTTIAVERI